MYSSRLPPMAAAAMASSLFVVFPMAETTTTGWRAWRARTMPATRVMAAADSTEGPPNFMTIIIEPHKPPPGVWGSLVSCGGLATRLSGLRNGPSSAGKQPARRMPSCPTASAECHYTLRASLVEHPFRMHQLGIQYGSAGRAADGVVAEHDEFVVENMAGAQAPHEGGHAALALRILARLRAVGLVHIDDGARRRAGQIALLGHAAETFQRLTQVSLARLRGKCHRHGFGVAIHHGDAVAVRAHLGGQRSDVVAREIAQDLLRFHLHLLFFAADEGDHVAHDVHAGDARVSRAGDGLHGGDDYLVDAELLERAKRHHQADRGAIWIGHDLAFPPAGALLAGHELEVIGIDFGHQQRNILLHAMVARVGNHH